MLALDAGRVTCPDGGACIFIDPLTPGRVVPSTLFGDQMPNLNSGTWFWDAPDSPSCAGIDGGGEARQDLMTFASQLGLTLLRYPGGTPGDFFHWSGAVGPTAERTPQIDPFQSAPPDMVYYCPTYGPDEFAQVASALGAQMLLSANVGTGTASEVAGWLQHYENAGVRAQYWEIGNENYIPGYLADGGPYAFSGAYQDPAQYAATFNAYAASLRKVDPSVFVGAVIDDDANRNSVVVAGSNAPDFYAVHIGYAPSQGGCYVANDAGADAGVSEDEAWRSTLSTNILVRYTLTDIEQQVAQYGPSSSVAAFALTEHGSDWSPCSSDPDVAAQQLEPNYMLAGALYSATLYDLLIADPQVVIANHINVTSPFFEAAVRTSTADGFSDPVVSPFFYVFQLYAQSAGGTYLPSAIFASPTYDASVPFGGMVPVSGVSSLDSVAVESSAGDRIWVYVVNRDLTRDATAAVALNGLSATHLTVEVVDGASYDAVNSPANPTAVGVTTSTLPAANPFPFTFPAHSLTRITVR